MLVLIKSIPATIQRFVPLAVLVAWFGFCFQIPSSVAQDDVKFREFDRNMVHSPRELARDLNYLFLSDKENPFSDIDPEKLKKITELGKNFMENLSDEEKKQAQEFAEKFMKDKGLDSPEGKLLMDSLGVSPEMQSELAKEFGDNAPEDLERFRDLFKDSGGSSNSQGKEGTGRGQRKMGDPVNRKMPGSGEAGSPSGLDPGQPGESSSGNRGTKDRSSSAGKGAPDLFESLPNELNDPTKRSTEGATKGSNKGSNKGESANERTGKGLESKPGDFDGKLAGDRDHENESRNPQRGDPTESNGDAKQQQAGKSNRRGRGKGKSASESLDPSGEGRGGASVADGGEGGKVDLSKNRRELDEVLKMLEQLDRGKRVADKIADLRNKRSADAKKLESASQNNPIGNLNGDESNREVDETFKSWIQMEAIRKKIREFQEGGGASDFQRRSLESAFKKGFKGLGESLGDTLGEGTKGGLSESEFKDKIDRVLFKAARDSTEIEAQEDPDSDGLGGAVGNTLDGLLDRVSEAAKKRKEQKQRKQAEDLIKSRSENFGGGPGSGGSPFGFDDLPSSDGENYGTDALGAAADIFENIPELPTLDLQKILIFVAIAAAVILLLYLLFRNFAVGKSSSAARKFGRSFQAAKIRSPKDLVEAVDYFIVQKFGNRAQWWNAKHAQDVLCSGAPGYSAKISDLLKDYVRARYTRSDSTLSSEQQQGYKKTLQELAREVPNEQQSPADASLDEG